MKKMKKYLLSAVVMLLFTEKTTSAGTSIAAYCQKKCINFSADMIEYRVDA